MVSKALRLLPILLWQQNQINSQEEETRTQSTADRFAQWAAMPILWLKYLPNKFKSVLKRSCYHNYLCLIAVIQEHVSMYKVVSWYTIWIIVGNEIILVVVEKLLTNNEQFFMKEILHKLEIDKTSLNIKKAVYSKPITYIIVNEGGVPKIMTSKV